MYFRTYRSVVLHIRRLVVYASKGVDKTATSDWTASLLARDMSQQMRDTVNSQSVAQVSRIVHGQPRALLHHCQALCHFEQIFAFDKSLIPVRLKASRLYPKPLNRQTFYILYCTK